MVKHDKTSGLDRNHRQKMLVFKSIETLILKVFKVLSFIVMDYRFLASHDVYEKMSLHVCKTTNWRLIYNHFHCISAATDRQINRWQLWLNAIKRVDWTEMIVKNAWVCSPHLLKRFNKVLSFVVMDESWTDFLPYVSCISRCRVWKNVCACVCKTTNWCFIYNHL